MAKTFIAFEPCRRQEAGGVLGNDRILVCSGHAMRIMPATDVKLLGGNNAACDLVSGLRNHLVSRRDPAGRGGRCRGGQGGFQKMCALPYRRSRQEQNRAESVRRRWT